MKASWLLEGKNLIPRFPPLTFHLPRRGRASETLHVRKVIKSVEVPLLPPTGENTKYTTSNQTFNHILFSFLCLKINYLNLTIHMISIISVCKYQNSNPKMARCRVFTDETVSMIHAVISKVDYDVIQLETTTETKFCSYSKPTLK